MDDDTTDVELPELDSYALSEAHDEYKGSRYRMTWTERASFEVWLSERYEGADVEWCEGCDSPFMYGEGTDVDGQSACEQCADNACTCDRCGCLVTDLTGVSGQDWCGTCRDNHSAYCDECEDYYDADDTYDVEAHKHQCDCAPKRVEFRMVNGEGFLTNDTRLTVSLPVGVIDEWGIRGVAQELAQVRFEDSFGYGVWPFDIGWRALLDAVGCDWKTDRGTYPKRLSSYLYKRTGHAVPADVLAKVGKIAKDHSESAPSFDIEVTRRLNLPAEEFAHEDSCWWGSYGESRCALKSNGGFGLRSFDDYRVSGRAWVMPLRHTGASYEPTFNAETPDAFVVFNGYGDLDGYTATRIVSQMTGWGYLKTSVCISPMYVNGEAGYLVAPADVLAAAPSVYLDLDKHSPLDRREALATV